LPALIKASLRNQIGLFLFVADGRMQRVQVKSAYKEGRDGGYSFRMHGQSQRAYREDEIEVLVAYVVPENAWYVFPVKAMEGVRSLKLFPGSGKKRSKYEKYREAWGILGVRDRVG
jgi:PD-(D/E)XK endonuclease